MKLKMDTLGFLQELNRLERCFNETVTGGDPSIHETIRLHNRAVAVFASTSLATSFALAAWWNEPQLVAYCRRLLHHVADTVRDCGLGSWLVNTIEEAALGVVSNLPCEWMPPMRMDNGKPDMWMLHDPVESHGCQVVHSVREFLRIGDAQHFDERQIDDMKQYGIDTFRMTAHAMLAWGNADPRCLDIAALLLCQTGLGVAKLERAESSVMDRDMVRRERMERLETYYRQLQLESDLDYAGVLYTQHASQMNMSEHFTNMVEDDGETVNTIAERYLYDARKLVFAYETLWDRNDLPVTDELLTIFEQEDELPCTNLWENPLFLQQTADTLFGNSFGIVDAFERRDRERFNECCEMLQCYCNLVDSSGLGILPYTLFDMQRRMFWESGACNTDGAAGLWSLRDLIDDMAYIMLARVPDPMQAAHIVRAVLEAESHDPAPELAQLCFTECAGQMAPLGLHPLGQE